MSADVSIIFLLKTPIICFSLHNTFRQFQAEPAMSPLCFVLFCCSCQNSLHYYSYQSKCTCPALSTTAIYPNLSGWPEKYFCPTQTDLWLIAWSCQLSKTWLRYHILWIDLTFLILQGTLLYVHNLLFQIIFFLSAPVLGFPNLYKVITGEPHRSYPPELATRPDTSSGPGSLSPPPPSHYSFPQPLCARPSYALSWSVEQHLRSTLPPIEGRGERPWSVGSIRGFPRKVEGWKNFLQERRF